MHAGKLGVGVGDEAVTELVAEAFGSGRELPMQLTSVTISTTNRNNAACGTFDWRSLSTSRLFKLMLLVCILPGHFALQ
jgi:hypothetical protein